MPRPAQPCRLTAACLRWYETRRLAYNPKKRRLRQWVVLCSVLLADSLLLRRLRLLCKNNMLAVLLAVKKKERSCNITCSK